MSRYQIDLTDEQIDTVFIEEFGIPEACEFYLDYTSETIENFLEARKNWEEPGRLTEGKAESGGFRYIEIERCKALRGQAMKNVIVVDFGPARAIYQS